MQANDHLHRAMADGYFIEAVALLDSMISDRLEELLVMHKENVAMNSLGQLAQLSRTMDPDAFSGLANSVLAWAEQRNVVVHQMVKVGPEYAESWSQRLAQARATAQSGLELLDAVDRSVLGHTAAGPGETQPASAGPNVAPPAD